jgi:hypothetical protein
MHANKNTLSFFDRVDVLGLLAAAGAAHCPEPMRC